jgi:hypothetical protein
VAIFRPTSEVVTFVRFYAKLEKVVVVGTCAPGKSDKDRQDIF